MKSTICTAVLAAAATITLAACGGGSGNQPVTQPDPPATPEPQPPRVSGEPNLPLQRIRDAVQAPIVEVGGTTHVGLDVAPVRDGTWRDDGGAKGIDMYRARGQFVDMDELTRYVLHDYQQGGTSSPYIQRFMDTPPTVHLRPGTDEELTSVAVRAVQIINAALPSNWQISVSSARTSVDANGVPPRGTILVEFGARESWSDFDPIPAGSDIVGASERWSTAQNQIDMGRVWIDHARARDDQLLTFTIHEILHILGREHPQPGLFPHTIMNEYGEGVEGHELHPLDRETLNAIYDDPAGLFTWNGFIASDLGYWLEDTVHVFGTFAVSGGHTTFGIAQGIAGDRAWAYGPTPRTSLADNRALSGTAEWEGLMAGMDHIGVVAANADLSVDLEDLDGNLDFTGMRYLSAVEGYGISEGDPWGDGDLDYTIEVRGNTFVQTGGDAGIVTGAFFGTTHDGMGGSLERSDLTAAFGGTRQ